ncbi:ABC transporter permease [Levilactobacillus bambusae]|uniref:ABC transporter permease n=1 Tax=Levilactobacillus bambusae TaxID=2024736 RepID=A0A2V1N1D0_9LACO|nr:ABC transporter permease [Levilactobacillus bambusae]PWG01047.1 ABC transporter permease [Levilactobacillus bambusae]
MKTLFSTRLSRHLRNMVKYLRLVFNDFFIFALMFLIGGLGYGYSIELQRLHANSWWAPLIVIVVAMISVQIGRLATLIESADSVFLLPREHDMHAYLVAGRRYSLWLAMVTQGLVWFVLLPFIRVTLTTNWMNIVGLLIIMVSQKDLILRRALANCYRYETPLIKRGWMIDWGWSLILFATAAYGGWVIAAGLAIAADLVFAVQTATTWAKHPIDWRAEIVREDSRMLSIYRFFNLFTDVPMLRGTIHRRSYLDGLFRRIPANQANTFRYLYARGLVRGTEFSGLIIRLTLIGLVILYFVRGLWLPVIFSALFVYLLGFQLLPYFSQFDDNVFTHIYPVANTEKLKNFQQVMRTILIVTGVLFVVMACIANLNWETPVVLTLVLGVEIWVMVQFYAPRRLARQKN